MVGEFVRKIGIEISRTVVDLISAIALSGLIMTAIGTMNLSFLSSDFAVFAILYLAGTIWLLGCFVLLARKMFAEYWFQNAIISFGQSMGMTATGLLFAQMVDPKNRTNAVESFGYKQLLFEPLMGGGIVTALSMPIISIVGLPIFTLICGVITFAWMLAGLFYFGRKRRK
jgi:ESS family glutamate:Na+ symporter